MYTPPSPGQRLPTWAPASPAGTRKVRMPSTHIGIAVQPPAAITDEPVIQQMMKTYVATRPNVVITLGSTCSGTSSAGMNLSRSPDADVVSSCVIDCLPIDVD